MRNFLEYASQKPPGFLVILAIDATYGNLSVIIMGFSFFNWQSVYLRVDSTFFYNLKAVLRLENNFCFIEFLKFLSFERREHKWAVLVIPILKYVSLWGKEFNTCTGLML